MQKMSEKEESKLKKSNLIPFNKMKQSESRAIQSKGGKALKGLPKYSLTKCKNCKLPCPIKEEGTKEKWKCKVPDAKRKILEAALYPEKLTESLFHDAFNLQLNADNFNKKLKTFYAKLNLKKEVDPVIQKSFNVHGHMGEIKVNIIREDLKGENRKESKEKA